MNIPLQILQQFLRSFRSSIGDEDLAKVLFCHHLDQTLNAAVIEFVEDVVEEQEGFAGFSGYKGIELREFERNNEGFLLTLGAKLAQGVAINFKIKFISMNSDGCPLRGQIQRFRGAQRRV